MTFLLLMALLQSPQTAPAENDYFRVTHDAVPCASSKTPGCGDRVIVALGDIEIRGAGKTQKLTRGEFAAFKPSESYERPTGGGHFWEVAIKPNHPVAGGPPEMIPPQKNAMLHESEDYHIFREQLDPHDTRPRHSHNYRVVIQFNLATIHDRTEFPKPNAPSAPAKSPVRIDMPVLGTPKIHVLENISDIPLKGIVIELKTPGEKKMSVK